MVKALLDAMSIEIKDSVRLYPDEPETRVKKFVHMTITNRFRDVLR